MGRAGKKESKREALLGEGDGGLGGDQQQQLYHRFKRRIIVSDVIFKNWWSDLNSSDLVSLNSEMLRSLSSRRFPAAAMAACNEEQKSSSRPDQSDSSADETIRRIKEEMERKRALESKASQMNGGLAGLSPSISDANSQGSTLPKSLNPSATNRAMSEIVNILRFADATGWSRGAKDGSYSTGGSKEDEEVRRVWLPIARRTVQWSAEREKRSPENEKTTAASDV